MYLLGIIDLQKGTLWAKTKNAGGCGNYWKWHARAIANFHLRANQWRNTATQISGSGKKYPCVCIVCAYMRYQANTWTILLMVVTFGFCARYFSMSDWKHVFCSLFKCKELTWTTLEVLPFHLAESLSNSRHFVWLQPTRFLGCHIELMKKLCRNHILYSRKIQFSRQRLGFDELGVYFIDFQHREVLLRFLVQDVF